MVTIESILEEKKRFDLSLSFEKLGVDDTDQGWTIHAPVDPKVVPSLPSRSNILSISVLDLKLPPSTEVKQYVGVTTADRQLHLMDPTTNSLDVVHTFSSFQDSPTLDLIA